MYALGRFLLSAALNAVKMIVGAFVFAYIWSCFIVHQFNVQPIDFRAAFGVMFVVDFLLLNHLSIVLWEDAKNAMIARGTFTHTKNGWNIVKHVTMITLVYPLVALIAYIWHRVL